MSQTAAERFLEQYRTFESNGAGQSPEWIKKLRADAVRRFEETGFPTTRDEEWRFTSVKPIFEKEFALTGQPDREFDDNFIDPNAFRVAVINGKFSSENSVLEGLPEGVTVMSLAHASASHPDLVSRYLGKQAATGGNAFSSLSSAFLRDGVFVHVAAGVEVGKPIEILFAAVEEGVVEHPRVLVVAEPNARLQLVENFVGDEGSRYLRNCVSEIFVEEGAGVELCRLQRESKSAYHTATTHVKQERSSKFDATLVVLGSLIARHDLTYVLDGEGAEGTLRGLYLLDGKQHVDHNTVIDHAMPNCQSKEFLNGVLDGESHAVFTGRIVVREDAQKTDSKQSNNNVLLSESARVDSQPQLEIYADDVRCTHGATLGPLNEDSVLYLRTRGISEVEARRMLTYGFGVEIIDAIGIDGVRESLNQMVRDRLLVEV